MFPIDRSVHASYGGQLDLLGYGVDDETDTIGVLLHWRGTRRVEEDYKFFVHLCDAETGDLMAQADVMPHDWSFPTSAWGTGEVVIDRLSLSPQCLPPGDHRLLVGVYSPRSGERLPILDQPPGFSVRQDRLELPTVIVR